jgi:transposase-like protein
MGKYDAIKTLLYGLTIQLETATKMLEDMEEHEAGTTATAAETDACRHEHKLNLTVMGGPDHWKCKDCGFEFTGE